MVPDAGGARQPGHRARPPPGRRPRLHRRQPRRGARARRHLLPAGSCADAAGGGARRLGALHRLAGRPRRAARRARDGGGPGAGRRRPAGRARAGPGVALAHRPGALQRGGEPPPRRDGERGGRRGPARRAGPTRREPPPEALRGPPPRRPVPRRGLRRRHRPLPRPAGRRRPRGRPPGHRPRPPLRAPARLARRAAVPAGPRGRATWPGRSGSAGRTRRRSTTATRGGPRCARWRGSPATPTRCRRCPTTHPPRGRCAVQVLRTYPAKRPAAPFAPEGERSMARAYVKAFERARRLVYVEDQYLWSRAAAGAMADRLRSERGLHLVAVVPRYPDRDGRLSGPPYRIGQQRAIELLRQAGGERVAIFDLEARERLADLRPRQGVHHRRHLDGGGQRQLQPPLVDERLRADLRGDRRGARRPRAGRPRRSRRRRPGAGPPDAARPVAGAPRPGGRRRRGPRRPRRRHRGPAPQRRTALDAWCRGGRRGPRPPGRLRPHRPGPVRWWAQWWADPLHRLAVDPDGRPRALRRKDAF